MCHLHLLALMHYLQILRIFFQSAMIQKNYDRCFLLFKTLFFYQHLPIFQRWVILTIYPKTQEVTWHKGFWVHSLVPAERKQPRGLCHQRESFFSHISRLYNSFQVSSFSATDVIDECKCNPSSHLMSSGKLVFYYLFY